ncbi:MAG: CTP synthase [Candidatus Nezhaarchaeales archaeon]
MHGEVFVTEDGGEVDLDLGHYERFLDIELSRDNNITTGQVYMAVVEAERKGKYLGKCVQIIPHVTDEVKRRIRSVAQRSNADVTLVECGGTTGDIEGLPFLEAIRQMRLEEGFSNTLFVHVALVPILEVTGEFKTKPLQHSVQELRRIGIQPDIIVARCKQQLDEDSKKKIALYSNVPEEAVFTSYDVECIYELPIVLDEQGMGDYICKRLMLSPSKPDWSSWKEIVRRHKFFKYEVNVCMCGKYTKLKDSYISIIEALKHAGAFLETKVNMIWLEATKLECNEGIPSEYQEILSSCDGIVVLPGFGARGAQGKMMVIKYARENKIPFLGICFGMQLAVVEFARNVVGLKDANTTELDPSTNHPVVDLLPEQHYVKEIGGTMRLGAQATVLEPGTKVYELYGRPIIFERHRHRYEVNPAYWSLLQSYGMVFSGYSVDKRRVEFIELKDHPFFIATQAHPEFKSRPNRPSPLYYGFLRACLEYKLKKSTSSNS